MFACLGHQIPPTIDASACLVAVYCVGACVWLPNQVGMQMLAQKVDAYGPCISLKCYHKYNKFWNVIITNTQSWMHPFVFKWHALAVRRLESKMNRHGDRWKICVYESTQTVWKNLVKWEMKAEWKKSKCCLYSAASSHPNKATLTIFSLVAEYFLQPPRTLHACYPPFSTLNSNFQCLAYFMNACTGSHRRN